MDKKRPRRKMSVEVVKKVDIPRHFFTRTMSRATCCEQLAEGQIIRIPDIFPSNHLYRLCRVIGRGERGVLIEVLSSSLKGEPMFLDKDVQENFTSNRYFTKIPTDLRNPSKGCSEVFVIGHFLLTDAYVMNKRRITGELSLRIYTI